MSGVRTPTSQMSSSSGHYSPYQTQPPSNPGMGVPTPPGRTPPETHGSSGAGQLQEHNPNNSGTTQAATTPSGEWTDIVFFHIHVLFMTAMIVLVLRCTISQWPHFQVFPFLRNCLLAKLWIYLWESNFQESRISHALPC